MCGRAVEANLSTLDSSCVELGPSATVHLDVLARLGQSCNVRPLAVVALIWGNVTYDSGGGPALEPQAHKAKWVTSLPECLRRRLWWRMAGTSSRRRRSGDPTSIVIPQLHCAGACRVQ